jgi:hypothetical protein
MPFLLLYVAEGRKFDEQAVTRVLQQLNGSKPLQRDDDSLSTYQYERGNDITTIRLKKDRDTIVIDGSGEASLAAAVHIQSNYPEAIHLIDEGYSFDLILHGITSVDELYQRIRDAGG